MPNICSYCMQVKGKPENVEEFIKIIQTDYAYDKNGNCYNPSDHNKPVEKHFWRVFEANVESDDISYDIRTVEISGDCAWSVKSCMCDGLFTYQYQNPNGHGTTLQKESERLQLAIEVFSEECGMGFMEHYVVVDGNIIIDDCIDYAEYYTGDFDTVEEMNVEYGTNFTQEEFEANEYISVGGIDWEFGNW